MDADGGISVFPVVQGCWGLVAVRPQQVDQPEQAAWRLVQNQVWPGRAPGQGEQVTGAAYIGEGQFGQLEVDLAGTGGQQP